VKYSFNFISNYSGHLESPAGRYLVEEQYLMVGLVQWHYFIFFMMESGSANLEIQPAQMKCEFASPCCKMLLPEILRPTT